jgi:hypothetical protein
MMDWSILVPLFDAVAVSIILLAVHEYVETFVNNKNKKKGSA